MNKQIKKTIPDDTPDEREAEERFVLSRKGLSESRSERFRKRYGRDGSGVEY